MTKLEDEDLINSLLLSAPAYVREGCGDNSSRLSRHTSRSATTSATTFRLVEAPSGYIRYPQCSLPSVFVVVPRPFPFFGFNSRLVKLANIHLDATAAIGANLPQTAETDRTFNSLHAL